MIRQCKTWVAFGGLMVSLIAMSASDAQAARARRCCRPVRTCCQPAAPCAAATGCPGGTCAPAATAPAAGKEAGSYETPPPPPKEAAK